MRMRGTVVLCLCVVMQSTCAEALGRRGGFSSIRTAGGFVMSANRAGEYACYPLYLLSISIRVRVMGQGYGLGLEHVTDSAWTGNDELDAAEEVLLGSEQELQVSQSDLSELGEDTAEETQVPAEVNVASLAQDATCQRDETVPETCQGGIDGIYSAMPVSTEPYQKQSAFALDKEKRNDIKRAEQGLSSTDWGSQGKLRENNFMKITFSQAYSISSFGIRSQMFDRRPKKIKLTFQTEGPASAPVILELNSNLAYNKLPLAHTGGQSSTWGYYSTCYQSSTTGQSRSNDEDRRSGAIHTGGD